MWKTIYNWLDERMGLNDLYTNLLDRPEPKTSWWNTLGSASMFLFILQGLTGIFLTVYYTPPKDVTDSIYSWETERTVTEEGVKNCNTSIYPKDTVYITARGTVGNLCMGQRPMAMNQSCFALQAKPPLSQYYLLFALKEAVPHLLNQSSGSVFDAIVRVAFTRVKVIVPTKEVVDRFTEWVTPMVKQVDVLSQQNRQLTRARDLLLPRLMNGKVRV